MHTDKMLSAALFPPLSIFHTTTQSQTLVIHLCSKEGEGAAQPWDLSLPQTPSGARHLPMISSTLVFTLTVQELEKCQQAWSCLLGSSRTSQIPSCGANCTVDIYCAAVAHHLLKQPHMLGW